CTDGRTVMPLPGLCSSPMLSSPRTQLMRLAALMPPAEDWYVICRPLLLSMHVGVVATVYVNVLTPVTAIVLLPVSAVSLAGPPVPEIVPVSPLAKPCGIEVVACTVSLLLVGQLLAVVTLHEDMVRVTLAFCRFATVWGLVWAPLPEAA